MKRLRDGEPSQGEGARTEETRENAKEKGRQQIQDALETAKAGSELKTYFIKTQTGFPDS